MKNLHIDNSEKELLEGTCELELAKVVGELTNQTKDLFNEVIGEKLMNIKCDKDLFCFEYRA